jgi:hypothetical protein
MYRYIRVALQNKCLYERWSVCCINLTLAEEIFPLVTRITEMWGVAKQISSRRNPGWDVEVHFKLAIE